MEKLQQLEKLRSQGILKEEEFEKGRESAIKNIIEITENLIFPDMD